MRNKKQIYIEIQPGGKLQERIATQLKDINSKRKGQSHRWYIEQLKTLFQLPSRVGRSGEKERWVLAGFVLGEGSLNVSAKREKTARFGFILDPEFSLTQHFNGVSYLLMALEIFQTGRITYKSGSNATLTFTIDSRQSLKEKVQPFCEKYCILYASYFWGKRFESFKELLQLFSRGAHLDFPSLVEKMLPLWDKMRKQKGQKNASFASIKDVESYIKEFVAYKKRSSETKRDLV